MYWKKGKKRARKGQDAITSDQKANQEGSETTQKLSRNKILRLHLYRKELSSFCFRIHMQDVKKSHLTWAHCQKMG